MDLQADSLEDHISATVASTSYEPRPPGAASLTRQSSLTNGEQLRGLADYQHSSLATATDAMVELPTYTWAITNCLSQEQFRSPPFQLGGATFTLGFWPRGGMVHLPLALPAGQECSSASLRYEGDQDALKCHVALRLLRPPPQTPPSRPGTSSSNASSSFAGSALGGSGSAVGGAVAQEAVAVVLLGRRAVADLQVQRSVGWERFVRLSDLVGDSHPVAATERTPALKAPPSPPESRGCLGLGDVAYVQVGLLCFPSSLNEARAAALLVGGGSLASDGGHDALLELEQRVNQEFADAVTLITPRSLAASFLRLSLSLGFTICQHAGDALVSS